MSGIPCEKEMQTDDDNCISEWEKENQEGRKLALKAIEHMRLTGSPNHLGFIVKDMIERGRYGGTEVGFFHVISIMLI